MRSVSNKKDEHHLTDLLETGKQIIGIVEKKGR